jgi:hypothetical protein
MEEFMKKTLFAMYLSGSLAVLLLVAVLLLPLRAVDADSQAVMYVVASNLDNPRGLTFGPDGALYVAEAGTGGAGPCVPNPKGGPDVCYGASGAVTQVDGGVQTRVVTGLPSLAVVTGTNAIGPSDVAFDGAGDMFVTVGLGADPAVTQSGGDLEGLEFGHIVQATGGGGWTSVVDVAAYEGTANPDGGLPDSNPNSLIAVGSEFVVADAGGNSLVHVDAANTLSTVAVFPETMVEFPPGSGNMIPMQAVPTSVISGVDCDYHVGQLTGFPFPVGGANVFCVDTGQPPAVHEAGFTNILDIALGADGSLYVLEMAMNSLLSGDPTGALVRVAPDGTRTTLATNGLFLPTGMTLGPDNALYVSNYGVFPGDGQPSGGQVVRISLQPTSVSLTGIGGQASGLPLLWLLFGLAVVLLCVAWALSHRIYRANHSSIA